MSKGNAMMRAEIARERSKVLSGTSWSGANLVAKIIVMLIYLFIVIQIIRYHDVIEPAYLVFALMGAYFVFIPATLHGSIAGERESRSLDMLLAAPVTAQQVVLGKLARAIVPITWLALALGVPGLILAFTHEISSHQPFCAYVGPFIVGFLYALLTAATLACLVTYISSRAKTTAAALMATIGVIFVGLFVYPAVVGIFTMGMMGTTTEFFFVLHPFVVVSQLFFNIAEGSIWMVISSLAFLVGSVALIGFATQSVSAEYREGKGMSQKREEVGTVEK